MTPLQRLSAIAKVLDRYEGYFIGKWPIGPQINATDFRKLKQLANPKKSKRKGKR